MTKIEATVAVCKCKETHKSYGVRFERISQGHWKYTWAFPVKEAAAKREGYDATIIIGVFARQRAVCEGIAKATKLLLNTVNVGCIVVSGKASLLCQGEHAWNVVKMDGNAYHLDVTWDMANSREGQISYDYYNLSDEAIRADHSEFEGIPACTSEGCNYFNIHGLKVASISQLEKLLLKRLYKGESTFYFEIAKEGHTMPEIIRFASNFVLAETSKNGINAKAVASYNEEQRTGRVTVQRL